MRPPPRPALPWRIQFSSTLKSIYLIRYLLFSGGVAVGLAVLQRAVTGTGRPVLGLLLGLVIGLVAFRGQLRPFSLPTLALGQESLLFVRKRKAIAIPWRLIREVRLREHSVALTLHEPTAGPDGRMTSELELPARDFGISASLLAGLLQPMLDPTRRAGLPTDQQIREALGVQP